MSIRVKVLYSSLLLSFMLCKVFMYKVMFCHRAQVCAVRRHTSREQLKFGYLFAEVTLN